MEVWHTAQTLEASHYGPLARPLEGMKEENPLEGKILLSLPRVKAGYHGTK